MGDDPRGFIISLDLLFAIIPLTIVLGMVAADMGNILYEIEDAVYRSSTDRVAEDTINTLTQTSGDPYNWEQIGTVNIVGLAKYDISKGKPIPGTIDSNKFALVLSNNGIQNIIGNNNTGFYLTLTQDGTNTTLNSTGTNPVGNSSINDIVRVDKVVSYSKLESVTSLVGQIRYSGQTRNYAAPTFQTSGSSIANFNYYILFVNTGGSTNSNATVNINAYAIPLNNTIIFNPYQINSTYLATNSSNAAQLLNNTVTLNITTNNIGSTMDFYIVQVPKSTSNSSITYDNVVPKNCTLTLYLWNK